MSTAQYILKISPKTLLLFFHTFFSATFALIPNYYDACCNIKLCWVGWRQQNKSSFYDVAVAKLLRASVAAAAAAAVMLHLFSP